MQHEALAYLFQQGIGIVVLVGTTAMFALVIRKLFGQARVDRDEAAKQLAQAHLEARDERTTDRVAFAAMLAPLAVAVEANTRATERLTDRIVAGAGDRRTSLVPP